MRKLFVMTSLKLRSSTPHRPVLTGATGSVTPGLPRRRCERPVRSTWSFVLVALLLPALAVAQQPEGSPPSRLRQVPADHTATLSGTVLDAITGAPVAGAWVAPRWPAADHRVQTDPHGRFLVRMVEPGAVTVDVHCAGGTMFAARVLETVVQVDTGTMWAVEMRADFSSCPIPSLPTRRLRARGVYSAGLEHSRFIPCQEDTPEFRAVWGPEGLRRAWVKFQPEARPGPSIPWPASPGRDASGDPRVYVEWSGILAGPGRFGHMGVSPYWLSVDSIQQIAVDPPGHCVLVEQVESLWTQSQPELQLHRLNLPPSARSGSPPSTLPSAVTPGDRSGRESPVP